jgi:uncharacterized membrane protein
MIDFAAIKEQFMQDYTDCTEQDYKETSEWYDEATRELREAYLSGKITEDEWYEKAAGSLGYC